MPGGFVPLDEAVLARVWHRPPYALTLRQAGHAPGARGIARISTTGSFLAFRARVATMAALLLDQPAAAPPAASRRAWARLGGWWRYQRALWQARLLRETWNIGRASQPISQIAATGDLGRITWAVPPAGSDLADPFALPGSPATLCEEVPAGGSGRILRLLLGQDGTLHQTGALLDSPGMHHSYPCPFQDHDGAIYLMAESLAAPASRIFRLAGGQLDEVARLDCAPSLADPTLFAHAGLYWVAGTDPTIGLYDNLCLFHAPAITGPWHPHRGNPVKIDIGSSRPAGAPFLAQGRLIRPAQDCAASYGAAIVLNEIIELSPESFSEIPRRRIAPDPHGPYPHGLHTLSADGDTTLIDGKRLRLDAMGLIRKIKARARARRGKAPAQEPHFSGARFQQRPPS